MNPDEQGPVQVADYPFLERPSLATTGVACQPLRIFLVDVSTAALRQRGALRYIGEVVPGR